ncbi:hypothetical protein BJ508DRAFT_418162 [Ascobolus immersus RN42]|uniref:Uncharacterized protein n=1 Tax=Ascobolus immersus RN42 TaxID=1160509 RepID=A0A3N4I0M4_ASCIM|nr:hypothetical protein BJ508DRAFT_418162 [Ascobolus immersus RN42]
MGLIASQSTPAPDYVDLLFSHYHDSQDGLIDLSGSQFRTPSLYGRYDHNSYTRKSHPESILSALRLILPFSDRWNPTIHKKGLSSSTRIIPPPFHQIVAEYLLFYLEHLRPYLQSTLEELAADGLIPSGWGVDKMDSVYIESCMATLGSDNMIARYNAGLLREGQIRLIGETYRGLINDIRLLMREEDGLEKGERLEELLERVYMCKGMVGFLGGIRSERMEVLVGRYLDADATKVDAVHLGDEDGDIIIAKLVRRVTLEKVYETAREIKEGKKPWDTRYQHILNLSLRGRYLHEVKYL